MGIAARPECDFVKLRIDTYRRLLLVMARLDRAIRDIDSHSPPGGLVILLVSPNFDVIEGVELHQTIQQRPGWAVFFASIGWADNPAIIAFLGDDLVRWEANAPNSFHFALSRAGEVPVLTRRARHLAANSGQVHAAADSQSRT